MGTSVEVRREQLSPVEQFVMDVLPADRLTELSKSLPAHIKPAMFQRNLLNAIMINPDLMKHPPGLLFREVSKAAALGLFLDPQLGEAYIVEAYNYKTRNTEPQLRIGYQGMVKLARQSGEVKHIYAHEVHANDHIEATLGADKTLVHKPQLFSDRGPIIGYYAVAKFADGDFDFEPMDLAQIHGIRDRSDGFKAFTDKKIKSTPWVTDESEMAKKTVIRRLTKRIPKSPEMASAIRIEDEAEHSEFQRPRLVHKEPPPPPPPAAQIETKASEPPPPAAKEPAPPPPGASAKEPAPPPGAAPARDKRPLIDRYKDAISTAKDGDELDKIFSEMVEPAMGALTREEYEEFMAADDARRGELEG
jgi:recombination protein RecT